MKSKLRCLLVGTLMIALLACHVFAAEFPDVDEAAEYAEAVDFLSEMGLMVGDNNGNFNPNNTVTRAEMAAIICRLLGETENLSTTAKFPDVPVSHWANAYIGKTAELGVVNGYDNGNFGPSDTVTYEQAVTMIVRATGYEVDAKAEGGYPYGYISIASKAGYLENLSAEIGNEMMRWQIAIVCYHVMMGGNG